MLVGRDQEPGRLDAALDRSSDGPLSHQLEVAQLAARGLTGPEIAGVLLISPHTVSTHIKNVYARIEVSSRAERTAWMIAHEHAEPLDVP